MITYTSILDGLCNINCADHAMNLLRNLQSYGCRPDIVTYNIVFKALCSADRWKNVEQLMADKIHMSCPLDEVTFNTIIISVCQKGLFFKQLKFYG
jgi:pentatricopeptide repeat protein